MLGSSLITKFNEYNLYRFIIDKEKICKKKINDFYTMYGNTGVGMCMTWEEFPSYCSYNQVKSNVKMSF